MLKPSYLAKLSYASLLFLVYFYWSCGLASPVSSLATTTCPALSEGTCREDHPFCSGDGTQENPYIIVNLNQLDNIDTMEDGNYPYLAGDQHFRLSNHISLEDAEPKEYSGQGSQGSCEEGEVFIGEDSIPAEVKAADFTRARGYCCDPSLIDSGNAKFCRSYHIYPIGRAASSIQSFRGNFDGQNCAIRGLQIHLDEDNVALFARCESCTIRNLTIGRASNRNTSIQGMSSVAILASELRSATIEDIWLQGQVQMPPELFDTNSPQGLRINDLSLEGLYRSCLSSGQGCGSLHKGDDIGLLAGNSQDSVIKNIRIRSNTTVQLDVCSVTREFDSYVLGKNNTGGLIGASMEDRISNSSVLNLQLIGTGARIGGLLGSATRSSVKDSQVRVSKLTSLSGGVEGGAFGGLIGERNGSKDSDATFEDSYVSYALLQAYADSGNTLTSIGGLIGRNTGAIQEASVGRNIRECLHTVHIEAHGDGVVENVGGLAGEHRSGGIQETYVIGLINHDSTGGTLTGALIGLARAENNSSKAILSSSYFHGSVWGKDRVGGLIAELGQPSPWASIEKSYSQGELIARGVSGYSGGLVGYISASGSLSFKDNYSAARLRARNAGGLVARLSNSQSTFENHYFHGTIQASSAGGLIGAVSPGASAELDDTYVALRLDASNMSSASSSAHYHPVCPDNRGRISAATSYWNSDIVSDSIVSAGFSGFSGISTQRLLACAASGSLGGNTQEAVDCNNLYQDWAPVRFANTSWDFGLATEYPLLLQTPSDCLPDQKLYQAMSLVQLRGINDAENTPTIDSSNITRDTRAFRMSWSQQNENDMDAHNWSSVNIKMGQELQAATLEDIRISSVGIDNLVWPLELDLSLQHCGQANTLAACSYDTGTGRLGVQYHSDGRFVLPDNVMGTNTKALVRVRLSTLHYYPQFQDLLFYLNYNPEN